MTWRLETSSNDRAQNRVTIQPVEDNDPASQIQYVVIRVIPWGDNQAPTLPLMQPGFLYRDRTGLRYTIVKGTMAEEGDGDEITFWAFEYLAAIGVHELAGLLP